MSSVNLETSSSNDSPTTTVESVSDESLTRAAEMLGTTSPQDTVNEALREVVRLRMIDQYVDLLKRLSNTTPTDDARSTAWR